MVIKVFPLSFKAQVRNEDTAALHIPLVVCQVALIKYLVANHLTPHKLLVIPSLAKRKRVRLHISPHQYDLLYLPPLLIAVPFSLRMIKLVLILVLVVAAGLVVRGGRAGAI